MSSSDNFSEFETLVETSEQQVFSKNLWYLILSQLFERASYYGIRSVLFVYLTQNEKLAFETYEIFYISGIMAGALALSELVGGFLGDLLVGNKKLAWIGNIIQLLGLILICFDSRNLLYLGVGIIGVGGGLYHSNFSAMYAKSFLGKLKQLDAGFTMLYAVINIGSVLGILLLGNISNDWGYAASFAGAGVLLMLSFFFMLLSNEQNTTALILSKVKLSTKFVKIFLGVVFFVIFWLAYRLLSIDLYEVASSLEDSNSIGVPSWIGTSYLDAILTISFSILLFFLWTSYHWNRYLKMALGLLLGGLAFSIILNSTSYDSEGAAYLFLLAITLMAIAEIMIGPALNAIVTVYVKPKYLAIAFGLLFLPARLTTFLSSLFEKEDGVYIDSASYIGMALFIVGALSAYIYFKMDRNSLKK